MDLQDNKTLNQNYLNLRVFLSQRIQLLLNFKILN